MRKLIASSIVAASVLATAGLAKIATDGTGQYLVAPGYYTTDGFSTKLKLVNTSQTHSYVYRVALREYVSSEEFDFLVLLSPTDVWDAEIYKAADGSVKIKSTDDSNYGVSKGFDQDIAKHYNANKSSGKATRTFKKGYVEFIPIGQFREVVDGQVSGPISKSTLKQRLDKYIADGGAIGGKTMEKVADDAGVSGYVTLVNPGLRASMTLPMIAFEGVVDALPNGANIKVGSDAVIENYLGNGGKTQVLEDLKVVDISVPFEGYGVNDDIKFAFLFDGNMPKDATDKALDEAADATSTFCSQTRSFKVASRDMKEGRGQDLEVIFSPNSNPDQEVRCEFGTYSVSDALTATQFSNVSKGMVKIYDMKQEHDNKPTNPAQKNRNNVASAIVTHMMATEVGKDDVSFSWVYPAVKR